MNRVDPTGGFWDFIGTVFSEIGKAFGQAAPVYAGIGAGSLADGPLLFADAIVAIGGIAFTVGVLGTGISNGIIKAIQSSVDIKAQERAGESG